LSSDHLGCRCFHHWFKREASILICNIKLMSPVKF
jgi:hypothetical protein